MPEMDRVALAQQLVAERPNVRVLLTSGYTDVPQRLPFLRKSFRMHELLEKVRKVIDGPPPFAVDAVPDTTLVAEFVLPR